MAAPPSLWRRPLFRRLLLAHVLAVFADTSVYIVFAIWAKQLTGTTASAGVVFASFVIPSLLGPLAGNFVDGLSRKWVIFTTNLLMAAGILTLKWATAPGRAWLLYAVTLLYGFGYVIYTSARAGIVVSMFERAKVGPINSALRTSREALRLAAPLMGTGLFVVIGPSYFILAVASALGLSAFLFALVQTKELPAEARPKAFSLMGLESGVAHLWREPVLRALLTAVSITLLVAGFFEVTLLGILDHLGRPATDLGYLVTAQGSGAVLGGLWSGRLIRRQPGLWLVGLGFLIQSLGALALTMPNKSTLYGACAVFGLGIPISLVGMDTAIQLGTPEHLQGRVGAAVEALTSLPFAASFVVSSLLITRVGYFPLALAMAVLTFLCSVPLLLQGRKMSIK
jgi:MFS family permease